MRPTSRTPAIALTLLAGVTGAVVTWKLWELRSQVDRYARYWSVSRGQPGGLRYVALGDSAAQGIGASSPQQSYVSLLAQRLQSETGRDVTLVNLSTSGARLRDVIHEQLPHLSSLRPDVVTVDVGANDIVAGWNRDRFTAEAATLCDGLAGLNAVVGDVPYFMHGHWERDSCSAARILRQECQMRGIKTAPLHATLAERGWWGMFNLYAADWFHLNNKGHRVWADAFWLSMSTRKVPPAPDDPRPRALTCHAQAP